MLLVFLAPGPLLLGLLVTAGCATWAGMVAHRKWHHLGAELCRSIIGGLVIIACLFPIAAPIAAYLSPRELGKRQDVKRA